MIVRRKRKLAPNGNAFAERPVRLIREECLDRFLILNHRYLKCVLQDYKRSYNEARLYKGIDQNIPDACNLHIADGPIRYRNVLGEVLHDYYRAA